MKQSYYNYIFSKGEYTYWLNGMTMGCFILPTKTSQKLFPFLEKVDYLQSVVPAFYKRLIDNGFLVDDDVDELSKIREANEREVSKKAYSLTILPTLDCNFKCWYCIQNHVPSRILPDMQERIKRHIDYMIEKEQIESLSLEWFGGEPFMYMDEAVIPLSEYAISRCKQAEIPFRNSATTNAYFLTPNRVDILRKLKFRFFQITLDGVKEKHDKVKYQEGCPSAFEHVLANVNAILRQTENIRILLRINYTDDTLETAIVEQVSSRIDGCVRDKISIALKKVWQERQSHERSGLIAEIERHFFSQGFDVYEGNLVSDFMPCYAGRRYFNAITYAGKVFKCTAKSDLEKDVSPGMLNLDGSITWRPGVEKELYKKNFECERCLRCKFLPVCMGNCPGNDNNFCKNEVNDLNFKDNIIQFVESRYRYQSNQ